MKTEDIERLSEIKDEMKELLGEADQLIRGAGGIAYERARAYWLGHIAIALDDDHEYAGGSMCTMQDTIDDLGE